MNVHTRFLTGGLAALAIASSVTLSPAAFADEPTRPCGQPAVPAVYVTVTHDPVLRQVPAITHDEWRWERTVTTLEHEFSRVVTPSYTETDWVRELPATTELEWVRTVVDQAGAPAVPGTPEVGHWETVVVTPAATRTLFEYEQQQTGKLRWEADGWNGEKDDADRGQGWVETGRTEDDVITPAVTTQQWVVDEPATPGSPAVAAVSHQEHVWATTSPGSDWELTGATRTVGGGTDATTTTGEDTPQGDGWTRAGSTRTVPAVVETTWATDAPDGFTATGASRVLGVTQEETTETSAASPAGEGWSPVSGSLVVVVDVPATTELDGAGSTEQVLVSPELPATEPCQTPAMSAPIAGNATAAGPQASPAASTAPVSSVHAVAHSNGTATLPATGNPVSALLLATGLGALAAGGVLVRAGRRRQLR